MNRIHRILVAVCAASLCVPASGRAEDNAPKFGISSLQSAVVSAWDMQPVTNGSSIATPDFYRYINAGPPSLMAVVHVPNGSRLVALDLDACDQTPLGQVSASLYRLNGAPPVGLGTVSSGYDEVPGCGRFTVNLATPETVDNDSYTYVAVVSHVNQIGLESIGALRVDYQLQVSPAPGQATFGDVPTSSPQFQFVEALFAAGITAGCGNGNYCPNNPVTRGQMAVFLAKALGLHWAPLN